MLFFIRIIISFIINSLISPEERNYNSPKFNPVKIAVVSLLLLNLFITIHLLRRNVAYYDFLSQTHPKVLEEFVEKYGDVEKKELVPLLKE